MGAIQREGYLFEVEFSQISKTAAIHVSKNGQTKDEITFPFEGNQPTQEQIEAQVERYLDEEM